MTGHTSPAAYTALRDTEVREDRLLAERTAEHARTAALFASILSWATLPEAGEPGQQIVRLLADHGRQWVEVDSAAQTRRASLLGVAP